MRTTEHKADEWGAQEEGEGLFYAVSTTERIGPYPSYEEASREASRQKALGGGTLFISSSADGESPVRDLAGWYRSRPEQRSLELLTELIECGESSDGETTYHSADRVAIETAAEQLGLELRE